MVTFSLGTIFWRNGLSRRGHGGTRPWPMTGTGAWTARHTGRNRAPAVTIKDVARASGVSPATVTRVLNNHPAVRRETGDRVRRAIATLGYRPDSIARALVTRSTRTVGVLVPSSGDSFWGEVVAAIEGRAIEEGFSVFLANAHGDLESEVRAIDLFLSRQVDGIIATSTPATPRNYQGWFANGFLPPRPIVRINWDVPFSPRQLQAARREPVQRVRASINRVVRSSRFAEVIFDDFCGAVEATRHLVSLGHRRIGFVGLTTLRPAMLRYLGFRSALEERDLTPSITVECPGTLDAARAAARTIMTSSPRPPTAIVAYDDIVAIGVIRGLHSHGISVPDDVSVVGFDDIEWAEYIEPPLTTVRQPKSDMGRLAMEIVLRHRGRQADHAIHRLAGELIVRSSTAPAPTF
jgi:DNA-binding LacI/PurR family transcriptional regulator